MCVFVGVLALKAPEVSNFSRRVKVISSTLSHLGPGGEGIWSDEKETVGWDTNGQKK